MCIQGYEDSIAPLLRRAGALILTADIENGEVAAKGGDCANLVTAYDRAVQDMLEAALLSLYPDAVFLAEEQENDPAALTAARCFIIDPIDGTTNFIHGYRRSAISLAVLERGVTVFGAVYDPYLDELFTATLGGGTRVNGKPVRVATRPPAEGLVIFGTTPYAKKKYVAPTMTLAGRLLLSTRDLRRSGSAALDLAYVAAGRCDMFFELSLSPWDIAAGILLVREAGGIVTDAYGADPPLHTLTATVAATPLCHAYLLNELSAVMNEYDIG